MNSVYHNIPVSICIYAKENKCGKQFRLYFWFKLNCSGHFKMTNQLRYQTIRSLNITRETLNKQMDWLLRYKWMTYNSKTENFRVSGFKVLHRKTGLIFKTGVIWDDFEIQNFEAFMDASILFFYARRKSFYDNLKGNHNRSKDVPGVNLGHTRKRDMAPCYELPVNYMAKNINISAASIVKMKMKAQNAGFMDIRKHFEKINLPEVNVELYRRYSPEPYKIVVINKVVYIQQPDLLKSGLILKCKGNLKQIKPKNVKRNIGDIQGEQNISE